MSARDDTPRPLRPSVLGVVEQLVRAPEPASVAAAVAPRRDALTERAASASGWGSGLREAGSVRAPSEREDVTLAWELAHLVAAPRRAEAFDLVLAVLEAARRGSTRWSLPALEARAEGAEPQLALPFHAVDRIASLAPLVGSADEGLPLVRRGGHVALRRWATTERTLARDLLARARPTAERAASAVTEASAVARGHVVALRDEPLPGPRGVMQLTDEQEAAVAAMLLATTAGERTVVLTGGPGTGKTSVVVSFLRALARRAAAEGAPLDATVRGIALAAPTGKAADRLGEAVRTALARGAHPLDVALDAALASPTTLHRLLGYRHGVGHGEGNFRMHRDNPLAQRVVVVDEVSMIDTVLFERLLSAVAPDATLVLLGDPDQLPSVDPGAVLRDVLAARPAGVEIHALTRSHRMDPSDPDGAHVLGVARACLAGARASASVPFRRLEARETVVPVGRGGAWQLDATVLPAVLDAWIERHLLVEALGPLEKVAVTRPREDPAGEDPAGEDPPVVLAALAQLARARILTVTRRTAEDLDAYVSAAVARWRGESVRTGRILPGEPVLAVRNDYDEDLWNGDSGVAWRDERGETFVSFRRGSGLRTRPLAAVAHLVERSHAVTVHKAQGSEHDEILFVLPATDTPLSGREIVYTAITRARRSALVVGRAALLDAALERSAGRDTGLADALRLATEELRE